MQAKQYQRLGLAALALLGQAIVHAQEPGEGIPDGFVGVWAVDGRTPLVILNGRQATYTSSDGRMFDIDGIQFNQSGFFVANSHFSEKLATTPPPPGGYGESAVTRKLLRIANVKTESGPAFYGMTSIAYGKPDGAGNLTRLKVVTANKTRNLFDGTAYWVGPLSRITMGGQYATSGVTLTLEDTGTSIKGKISIFGKSFGIQGPRVANRATFTMTDLVTNRIVSLDGAIDWHPGTEDLDKMKSSGQVTPEALYICFKTDVYPNGFNAIVKRQ